MKSQFNLNKSNGGFTLIEKSSNKLRMKALVEWTTFYQHPKLIDFDSFLNKDPVLTFVLIFVLEQALILVLTFVFELVLILNLKKNGQSEICKEFLPFNDRAS